MTIGSLSQIGGGKKLDFLKKCSHENGRNFCSRINSKARRVPKRASLTGLSTLKQDGVSQKSFYGVKSGQKLKKVCRR